MTDLAIGSISDDGFPGFLVDSQNVSRAAFHACATTDAPINGLNSHFFVVFVLAIIKDKACHTEEARSMP